MATSDPASTLQSDTLLPGQDFAALLASIVDCSDDAIISKGLDGVIMSWNPAAQRIYGYGPNEVLGKNISLIVPTDRREELSEVLARIALGGRVEHHETKRVHKDGTILDISITVSPIYDTTGQIIGASAIGHDITGRLSLQREQKRLEDLEAEADRITAEGEKKVAERVRLEAEADRITAEDEKKVAEPVRLEAEADRMQLEAQLRQSHMESLGQLAGGVAHDFNNLLGVILNYAAFVAEELTSAAATPTGSEWEGPLKDVKQIQLAAERAALLTHQLLSFARREVVQTRALSLNSAITRMEQILRRAIGEQIELVISLAASLPMVLADPGQIEQIALNLAINARDAMPTGGILSIDTGVREIMENEGSVAGIPDGSYVCLRVGDTGMGMSAEVRDRAFEPFFTTKPRGEGSGLGLATVYGIVSQSGGYTRIYSDEGVGTSITILLPAAGQDAMRDEVSGCVDHLKPLVGTETILMADDEEGQREMTHRILTRNGYTVLTASSGAQAIEIATSHVGPIDLLLTDVIMPVMQGPTVAKEVRNLRSDVRVLFMSGHAQPVLETEGLLATEFLLVEKPFDEAKLLQNVRKVLDGNE